MSDMMDMEQQKGDYELRIEEVMSVYESHYESSTNKLAAVQEFIAIKNELKTRNEQTEESLQEELEYLRNTHKVDGGDYWFELIEKTFLYTTLGRKIRKEVQNQIIKLTDELIHDEIATKTVKITLLGCSTLADSRLKENLISMLIMKIIDLNYPFKINGSDHTITSGFNDRLTIEGTQYSTVKSIIHEMALKRSGPDKRSSYKYDDIFQALTKKYNNPGLRYKDLNTPIGPSAFSTMWTILNELVNDIDTSELD